MKDIEKKLNLILKKEKEMAKEEKQLEREERTETKLEKEELKELKKLEKELTPEIIKEITIKDIIRGSFGAFVGTVLHYTFIYGVKAAEHINMSRATMLYPLSFMIGMVFLYATGYRKVKEKKTILTLLPMRMVILYMVSLIVSILVLAFFYPDFTANFEAAYKQTSTVLLIAVLGACTADLVGRH